MNNSASTADTLCILHCGTEKTGSTSLQRFLALNAQALAKQSIWVPRSLVVSPEAGPYNHILVSTASRLSLRRPDDLQAQLGLTTMDEVLQHRKNVIHALHHEYDNLGFIPSIIIVSNEHIHSRLRNQADIDNVKALLQPFCNQFKVFVYLRNQLELARSLAVTSVRNGQTELREIPDFSTLNGFDPVLGTDFLYFNYKSFIVRLSTAFDEKALNVRIYGAEALRHKNIIDDFFFANSININGYKWPQRENQGLHQIAAFFLARLNKYFPADGRGSILRAKIIDNLERNYAASPALPSSARRTAFANLFVTDNEAVRERWFPEQTSLFRDCLTSEPGGAILQDLTVDDAFLIFTNYLASAEAEVTNDAR